MTQAELASIVCAADFRARARVILPRHVFAFLDEATERKWAKQANQRYLHSLMIVPRVLRGHPTASLRCRLFQRDLAVPFGFAPWASSQSIHPSGECAVAEVAHRHSQLLTVSCYSNRSLQDIATSNQDGFRFLQLYVTEDLAVTLKMVQLAQEAHFQGIVVTVDAQVLGTRQDFSSKDKEKFYQDTEQLPYPLLSQAVGRPTTQKQFLAMRHTKLDWSVLRRIKESTRLKVLVKGILHKDDALMAAQTLDGVWVSNHGGRQLDTVNSAAFYLPEIVEALKGSPHAPTRVPILVDGGVATGEDVFKLLALGADYVCIGRAAAFALAYGPEGVDKLVRIFEDELRRTMMLSGCEDVPAIAKSQLIATAKL